jgi:hypothetical protein
MPNAAQSADLSPPSRSGRLLSLVRRLVDYGKQLAATFRDRPAPNDPRHLVRLYGTSDISLILARIAQGLLRARYLEEKIASIAVLADICRDLGIPPSHELWDELYRVIKEYGGNSSRLYFDWLEQAFPIRHILARFKATPEARPEPAGTGPPLAIPA